MKTFNKVFGYVEKVCLAGSFLSTLAMMVLNSVDALTRYFFNSPIGGVYEITEDYLVVALVFLALSYTYKKGRHVRVEAVIQFIPHKIMRPIDAVFKMASFGFFLLLTIAGWQVFAHAVKINEFSNNILRYPLAPAYFLVVLGCALLCLRLIQSVFDPSVVGQETNDNS